MQVFIKNFVGCITRYFVLTVPLVKTDAATLNEIGILCRTNQNYFNRPAMSVCLRVSEQSTHFTG